MDGSERGARTGRDSTAAGGEIAAIHVTAERDGALRSLERANLVVDTGIEGDRYFGRPAYRNVTLVDEEVVRETCEALGTEYRPGCTRRNLTIRGLAVMSLLGRTFRVGATLLEGTRPCEPCEAMETSVGPGAMERLVHRAGIRARIVEGGEITIGDPVVPA